MSNNDDSGDGEDDFEYYLDNQKSNDSHLLSEFDVKPQDRLKKKDVLRKGKWTVEEENYTNKVIATFNAGLLRLPENERGTTLRSYLADKLACDPMRITKKYTGDSCLGKRVYHAGNLVANESEIIKAAKELDALEAIFRNKLEQVRLKKKGDIAIYTDLKSVSTPYIDAFILGGASAILTSRNGSDSSNEYQVNQNSNKNSHAITQSVIMRNDKFTSNNNNDNNAYYQQLNSSNNNSDDYDNDYEHYDAIDNNDDNDNIYNNNFPPNDDESLRKRIKRSETDQNAAASSLIGFFNHIQKVGSQEDLLEFFEGVQKTVSNSISSKVSPTLNNYNNNSNNNNSSFDNNNHENNNSSNNNDNNSNDNTNNTENTSKETTSLYSLPEACNSSNFLPFV